jgi:drug/metabolite transporter (DMT)-like permease
MIWRIGAVAVTVTPVSDGRTVGPARSDRTWMVALAAALWGTSALMREPLTNELGVPAATVVFFEHLILVLCLSPWLAGALRAFRAASNRTKTAIVVIGAGSSAIATTLFTAAFALGDPITPQALQKLQPLVAILLAAVILKERVRPQFWLFAVPAILAAWFLAFAEPFDVSLSTARAALLAVGAASLWAAGTVLGRFVGAELSATHVTTLRFFFGLVTMTAIVGLREDPYTIPWDGVPYVIVLALIPGLLALSLYYRGLRHTPATRATLAELAFPVTAAIVGVVFLGSTLVASQWVGFTVLLAAVTLLAVHEHRSRRPVVPVPDRVEDAVPVR